jgi:flavin reductase (DIM6/NTAB) family NADH-FMN oxidoreductase RutF
MDSQFFRGVLGTFPTGVVAITATDATGAGLGMAVGSFTSVSLDPPLVGFLPDKSSTTWPRILETGSFCVNVLGSEQESVCRVLASKGGDKFKELSWRAAESGSPILDGAVAWIDCDIDTVHVAGDHYIVVGRVRDLDTVSDSLPLIFFRGGYGRFASLSLSAWEDDLMRPMRIADLSRGHMETLSQELDAECVASSIVADDMVLIAASGAMQSHKLVSRVGERIPFVPPLGTSFVAHAKPEIQQAWLKRAQSKAEGYREGLEATLDAVRLRGFSVDLGYSWHVEMEELMAGAGSRGMPRSEMRRQMHRLIGRLDADYESPEVGEHPRETVGTVNVPVFGADGTAIMTLSALGRGITRVRVMTSVDRLQNAASLISRDLAKAGC